MAENNILKINGSIQVNDVVSINGTPEISETSIQAVRGQDLNAAKTELETEINNRINGLDSQKSASTGQAISGITQENGKITSISTTDTINNCNKINIIGKDKPYSIFIGEYSQVSNSGDNCLLFLY